MRALQAILYRVPEMMVGLLIVAVLAAIMTTLASCKPRPDSRPAPIRLGKCTVDQVGTGDKVEGYSCQHEGYNWSCPWRDRTETTDGRYVCKRGAPLAPESDITTRPMIEVY